MLACRNETDELLIYDIPVRLVEELDKNKTPVVRAH